jgi:uncharacterized protein YfaS (alpha-2-macroglobulin family)
MPTFPRFLSVRDQVSIPVTVRNDGGGNGRITVALNASRLQADIPKSTERTVYFPLQAPAQPGDLVLNITASGNGESAKSSATIPVRWDLPMETVEDAGRFTEPAALFRNDVLQQFTPGSVECLPSRLLQRSGRGARSGGIQEQ